VQGIGATQREPPVLPHHVTVGDDVGLARPHDLTLTLSPIKGAQNGGKIFLPSYIFYRHPKHDPSPLNAG
jgi:hypothetical protein